MSITDELIKDIKEDTDIKEDKSYNKLNLDILKSKKWINECFNKLVPNITFAKTNYEEGGIIRHNNLTLIKYFNMLDMHKNVIVVFKLKSVVLNKEINYGTLFCSYYDSSIENIYRTNKHIIDNGIVLNYINTSSSFISCDGEYKNRLLNYLLLYNNKNEYPELWDELEIYINNIIKSRKWIIYPAYYQYDNNKKYNIDEKLENSIKNSRLSKTLLILMWFHTICNEMINITETHINENVKDIFFLYKEEDIIFIKKLIKKYGSELIEKFRVSTSINIIESGEKKRHFQLGFKMIPLNIKEVQDPLKLRYKSWREILVSSKCNDIIANQIAPGFPILVDWMYIRNTNRNLYDNKSQYEKIKHSELARDIIRSLYEAQRGTYFITSGMLGNDTTNNRVKQWLNSKFKKLSNKIEDPIKYSIEELVMSDITLLYISEFVGRTYADIIEITDRSKEYSDLLGNPFNDYNIFAKYIFELCYNLLAINTKLGVIHGDLHLNNATIGYLYDVNSINNVVYEVDEIYVFPNNGYYSCLIDFSRCIINPEKADILTDLSIPTSFKPIKNYDKFASVEINNLLNLYITLFPNKEKKREELVVLCKNNYNEVFKLLTCIDVYMFTFRFIKYLQQRETKINKKCIDLLDRIHRMSESFIATDMNNLLNNTENYKNNIANMEWPIAQIIKKCFGEFINGKTYKNIGTITDAYSIKNDMIKSVAKYDLFPDIIKYYKYYENNKLIDNVTATEIRKKIRTEYEQKRLENLDYLKDIALKYSTFIDD
jgi:hypothetical protein